MQAGSDRRLAAILAADVVGYSRLMEADEAGTARVLREHRAAADPLVVEHGGRIVKTTGDGVLIEFPSVVGAVQCAVALQKLMAERNAGVPRERRMDWRVGIHLGDILIDGEDILGNGVNLAARLEGIAEPGGICISEDAFRQVRGKIETEFLDGGEQALKNLARPVRVYRAQPASAPVSSVPAATALPLPDKPSIAVLPFQNMSGDPEQEYFADGMVEEITTAIARLPWLFVIARNSSFAYKGKSPDVRQVGRELGVRYVLEGSVRKAGNRVRITGQLIDATTGVHIWADRIDGSLDDIFELQDQVAASVAGAIEPRLRGAEIERVNRKPTESLDTYDLYLRGLAEFNKFSQEGMREAVDSLCQALAISPSYAPAAALTGMCRVIQRTNAWIPAAGPEVEEAIRLCRRALELTRDDPDVLWAASYTLASLAHEHVTAGHGIDRALSLNPNSAHAWMAKGLVSCFSEKSEIGIEALQRATRLSPLDPLAYVFAVGLAVAHSQLGRYDEALEWAERALREHRDYVAAQRLKVAQLVHLDRIDEAREALRRLLELAPGLTIANLAQIVAGGIQSPGGAKYLEAFRKAGLPEQ